MEWGKLSVCEGETGGIKDIRCNERILTEVND
jgi:hypothetical protein